MASDDGCAYGGKGVPNGESYSHCVVLFDFDGDLKGQKGEGIDELAMTRTS